MNDCYWVGRRFPSAKRRLELMSTAHLRAEIHVRASAIASSPDNPLVVANNSLDLPFLRAELDRRRTAALAPLREEMGAQHPDHGGDAGLFKHAKAKYDKAKADYEEY